MSSNLSAPIGQDITEAVLALKQGKLLGFPTETVYGLGADALNEKAVSAVFSAKGRPIDHPLIIHIAGVEALAEWAVEIPSIAWSLAETFWPGPLTLVLKKHPRVPIIVTGGQDTVALRVPNHPVALSLLQAFGGGIVGPSANQYQRVSPTCAADVAEELGAQLAYILEGGFCSVGIESTIVACHPDNSVQILRQGAILPSAIKMVMKQSPLGPDAPIQATAGTAPRVPGSSAIHYAPKKPVFRAAFEDLLETLLGLLAQSVQPMVSVLAFSPKPAALEAWHTLKWEQVPYDSTAYQQQLYGRLRAFDKSAFEQLWIEAVPEDNDAWLAIRDRLQRATTKVLLPTHGKSRSLGRSF